jgi:hypothetical protein
MVPPYPDTLDTHDPPDTLDTHDPPDTLDTHDPPDGLLDTHDPFDGLLDTHVLWGCSGHWSRGCSGPLASRTDASGRTQA